MSASLFELRGVFLNSFNVITDAMGVFAKGIHKYSDAVIDDLSDVKKALKDSGLSGSSARNFLDVGELGRKIIRIISAYLN